MNSKKQNYIYAFAKTSYSDQPNYMNIIIYLNIFTNMILVISN